MFEHCNFGGPKRLVAVSGWHFVGPNALSGSRADNVTNISRQCLGMDGPPIFFNNVQACERLPIGSGKRTAGAQRKACQGQAGESSAEQKECLVQLREGQIL